MLHFFSLPFFLTFRANIIFLINQFTAVSTYINFTGSITMRAIFKNFNLAFSITYFTGNILFSTQIKFSFRFAIDSFKMIAYIKCIIFITCSATCITFLIIYNYGTYSFTFRAFSFHIKTSSYNKILFK